MLSKLLHLLLRVVQGPFLDSYHSLFGVLAYDSPLTFPILGSDGDILQCVTTYWVPPLFGLAGFLIGWLYIWLDEVFDFAEVVTPPKVLLGIAYFTLQYWLSGVLYANGVDRSSILSIMSALAAFGFYALDGTWSGFLTSTATALGGPLIEVGLISSLPPDIGYHYTDSGELGFFPLWILPVYFLGGPANGNLARVFWDRLGGGESSQDKNSQDRVIPCDICNGTRVTSCPNCGGQGSYVTYGERVRCTACRGKGVVICRSCFNDYGDIDPSDIEAVRRFMDRIPD